MVTFEREKFCTTVEPETFNGQQKNAFDSTYSDGTLVLVEFHTNHFIFSAVLTRSIVVGGQSVRQQASENDSIKGMKENKRQYTVIHNRVCPFLMTETDN